MAQSTARTLGAGAGSRYRDTASAYIEDASHQPISICREDWWKVNSREVAKRDHTECGNWKMRLDDERFRGIPRPA